MKAGTREAQLLNESYKKLSQAVSRLPSHVRQEARFQILEATASRFGGFNLESFRRAFVTDALPLDNLDEVARSLVASIERSGIRPALAVSALAREALDASDQRRSGAYHTDFRLAAHLADSVAGTLKKDAKVIDPACGAGILLAALSLAKCGADRAFAAKWLAHSVYASDLSENALRGTLISLACLTDDVSALKTMRKKWKVQDSLLAGAGAWKKSVPQGFDAVVGNPPWEKIKLTRHEFLRSTGVERHYGADYAHFDDRSYSAEKAGADNYGAELAEKYEALAGEPDLYVAFTELALNLAADQGEIGLLVPAGLIRSQSTASLRKLLLARSNRVEIEVLENRARFFEIDTRFKFLMVRATRRAGDERVQPIQLSHARGTDLGVEQTGTVRIGRSALSKLRTDLSIPEVRSPEEWSLFEKLSKGGVDWSDPKSSWHPEFVREVDMTRDRPAFSAKRSGDMVPVIEGRMVHQHRFGAKSYLGGTGRSADWSINDLGSSEVQPQFWISPTRVSQKVRGRSQVLRAGFCDITGQTNERSCLAAAIPAGVICGNKVPTVTFPNDPNEDRIWLWIGLANSLTFDWMVRRIITTTINYFHLLSLPLPPLSPDTLPGRQIVEHAKTLAALDRSGSTAHWKLAESRAKIEQLVLNAYGIGMPELDLILEDFPLVDRAQPPLPGETKSSVTRDCIASLLKDGNKKSARRLAAAKRIGAIPFVPAQVTNAGGAISGGEVEYG